MESPLQCFTNQPNSSHISNTGDTLFDSDTGLFHNSKIIKSENEFQEKYASNSPENLTIVNVPNIGVKSEPEPHTKEEFGEPLNEISTINVNDLKQEPLFRTDDFVGSDVNDSSSKSKPKSSKSEKKVNSKVPLVAKDKFRNIGTSKKSGTRSRDPAAKKHKCQFCDKSFACGYSLTRHVRIHTGEQCYPCDVCNKVFTTRSSKIRHDRTHLTQGTYKCEFCNLTFKRSFLLTEHQVVHTGEKPFSCGLCGKAFTKESQLASHLKSHVQDKYGDQELPPIETCELCNQGFPDNDHLLEHLKEHVADAEEQALQSDQVDSSSNVELDSAILGSTPIFTTQASSPAPDTPAAGATVATAELPPIINTDNTPITIKPEPQSFDSYYSATVVDNKLLESTDIDLESNIVYVVGEDGTLQPQLLSNTPFSSQHSTGFPQHAAADVEHTQNAASIAENSTSILGNTPSVLESTPNLLQVIAPPPDIAVFAQHNSALDLSTTSCLSQQNTVPSTSAQVSISASDVSVTVSDVVAGVSAAVSELVSTNNSSIASHHHQQSLDFAESSLPGANSEHSQISSPPCSSSSLIIAQADTTSLDSLKTDDEDDDESLSGPIEGQDILALACKEILIVPDADTASTDGAGFAAIDSGYLDTSQGSSSSGPAGNMLAAAGEKEKKFRCDYCDKSFTQSNNLDSHRRTHTKEKPFKCFHCDQCFSQRWSLTRHLRIHTGEKPFKCAFCDASFRIKGEKTEHEKSLHLNERNERLQSQSLVRAKSSSNGSDGLNRSLSDSPGMELMDASAAAHSPYSVAGAATTAASVNGNSAAASSVIISNMPKIEFNTNVSLAAESSSFVPTAASLSQTDDSDSRSDYESVQSSQYGDSEFAAATAAAAAKYSSESGPGSQDNSGANVSHVSGNEAVEIKFHYGAEDYMDSRGGESPVLTTLGPAEFIMESEKATLNYHCDFCTMSFATRSELVYHYSMHTGGS